MSFEVDTAGALLHHSGLVTIGRRGRSARVPGVRYRGRTVSYRDPLPDVHEVLNVRGFDYRVVAGGGRGRLQLVADDAQEPPRIPGPVRVHAGLHKCLTMYARAVYRNVCRFPAVPGGSFRHFHHRADAFYRECGHNTVASISGHAVDLDRFGDLRVVRFVRDPRDLVVSAYHYHLRGAEHWAELEGPTALDWLMVAGVVPTGVGDGSLRAYLGSVSLEEGLLAEIDFRRKHFESLRAWPDSDPRVSTLRYEDIVGDETAAFERVLEHLELPWLARRLGVRRARRLRAARRAARSRHIRDPSSGQWRGAFTPRVRRRFDEEWGDLLERLGYPRD